MLDLKPTRKKYSIVQISPQVSITPIDAVMHETCEDMQVLQFKIASYTEACSEGNA